MGRSRAAAWAATVAAGACVVSVAALLGVSSSWSHALYAALYLLLGAAPFAVGWFLVRAGVGRLGSVLTWIGVVPLLIAGTDLWRLVSEEQPGRLWVTGLAVGAVPVTWVLLYAGPAMLVLHFPDGRAMGGGWRLVPRALVGLTVLLFVLGAVSPQAYPPPFEAVDRFPLAVPPELAWLHGTVSALALLGLLATLVFTAAAVVVRRRRSTDPLVRAQLRWIALAGWTLPLTLLLCWVSYLLLDGPGLVVLGLALMWLSLPLATWVAVLHHDLYDVDRVQTVAATVMAVTTAALFVWTGLTVAVGATVGGERPALVAVVTAVLILAALPLRGRLTRGLERRLNPRRAAVREAVDRLLSEVEAGTAVPEQLEETLRASLGVSALRVGYLLPDAAGLWDVSGHLIHLECPQTAPATSPAREASGPAEPLTIRLGTREVARLTGLTPADRAVLVGLEGRIALVAELARLRVEVTAALRQTEESRRRLQDVGYAERRRLAQDLHDGAQQRLVSLGLNLRVAQRHLGRHDGSTSELIDAAVAELGTAVSELRQLAHGIRPACLDDGLGPALAPLTQSGPVPVRVDVAVGDVPDFVAATAYYVVMEAVTNALKHAEASQVIVSIEQQNSHLAVLVVDDGRGGADALGHGWSGVRDRVRAASGTVDLHSPHGSGTRLEVLLPCA